MTQEEECLAEQYFSRYVLNYIYLISRFVCEVLKSFHLAALSRWL